MNELKIDFQTKMKKLGSTRFRYDTMKSYWYSYSVDVASLIDGSDRQGQESRIHLMTNVKLDIHSPCHWTLQVMTSSLNSFHLINLQALN